MSRSRIQLGYSVRVFSYSVRVSVVGHALRRSRIVSVWGIPCVDESSMLLGPSGISKCAFRLGLGVRVG